MYPDIKLNKLHHVAIICSDYEKSKNFYTNILGFEIENEAYRQERQSYKLDLSLNGQYVLELFSFPNPPKRPTNPEATGLRHIAFEVGDIEENLRILHEKGVQTELSRIDEFTGKKFAFIFDPDNMPIELYEINDER